MSIGQDVTEALIELAKVHDMMELSVKDYANLRHGGPKTLGPRFVLASVEDRVGGHHATIDNCKVFVSNDVPELHVRVGLDLIRLPYPADFRF
jgi:hypothetical protein